MRSTRNLLLLLLVVVCALSLWLGRGSRGPEAPASATSVSVGDPDPWVAVREDNRREASAPAMHLAVLNGTLENGLAREIGLALNLVGCVTERVGNAPHQQFARCVLVNRRLSRQVARKLATRLGEVPVIEERDLRTTEDAVLVLGADHGRITRALTRSSGR